MWKTNFALGGIRTHDLLHSRQSGRWLCRKILSKYFHISLGVVRSLPWGPRGLAARRLPRMQEVVGSNPTEGKFVFHNLLYFVEWNVKNCFVKLILILLHTSVLSNLLRMYPYINTDTYSYVHTRNINILYVRMYGLWSANDYWLIDYASSIQ